MNALASLRVDALLSYAIAIIIPALDAILPVLPSETAIITLGVATAGSADPRIGLLVACSAAGAFLGDNLCYLLGRRFGPRIERRFFRGEKGASRLAWSERSLERYGMPLIVVCRFIPGGRTAVTLCCGIVRYQQRRFVIATAIAGVIWASYSFFIGRLGGKAFEDKPWAGLLLALGIAVAISVLIELVRRIRSRRAQARTATETATEQSAATSPGRAPRPNDADATPTSYERNAVLAVCARWRVARARNRAFPVSLCFAVPTPNTRNGHQSLRNRPYQTIRRGCHIHVAHTAWLGHPRLIRPADRSGGRVSPVTTARRDRSNALGVAGGGCVPNPQWNGRCGMGASLSCWSMSTRIASSSILQA